MDEDNKVIMYLTEEVEAKKLILSDIHSELIALGDIVEKLLMNPEDMEEGTPNGVKLIIKSIQGQIWNVLNSSCH